MTPVQVTHEKVGVGIQSEYSSMSPFSAQNRWLLLIHNKGAFGLYGGDGSISRMLPVEIHASAEPRWDRKDPDLLYFVAGNVLKNYQIAAGVSTVLKAFPEYTKISGRGESEISLDGDHIVLCGTKPNGTEEVFVYRISTARKGPVFAQPFPFDGLKILPSNQALLSRKDGIYLLRDPIRQIVKRNAHAAVAQYKGKDILVHVGGTWPDGKRGAVVMVDIDTPSASTPLMEFDYKYAAHVSTCEKDFCLVSLAAPDNSLPAEIWKAPFEGKPELVCQIPTKYRNYESAPKVSLSRDGSRAVFNVDDGKVVNVWMLTLDTNTTVKPVPDPVPVPVPVSDPLAGFHPIDFRSAEGKQYLLKLKVVNGKLECEMWEKPA